MISTEEFQRIKLAIGKAKDEKARCAGVLSSVKQRMKKEYGIESIDAAVAEMKSIKASIRKKEAEIEQMVKELNELVDWEGEYGS
jgi:peptidyl-tRNA hydrolase